MIVPSGLVRLALRFDVSPTVRVAFKTAEVTTPAPVPAESVGVTLKTPGIGSGIGPPGPRYDRVRVWNAHGLMLPARSSCSP